MRQSGDHLRFALETIHAARGTSVWLTTVPSVPWTRSPFLDMTNCSQNGPRNVLEHVLPEDRAMVDREFRQRWKPERLEPWVSSGARWADSLDIGRGTTHSRCHRSSTPHGSGRPGHHRARADGDKLQQERTSLPRNWGVDKLSLWVCA